MEKTIETRSSKHIRMHTPISETMAECTGPAQVWDQCRGCPSPERVSGHNPSPLTQKLSPIDIYWQMKNYFFQMGSHWVCKPLLMPGSVPIFVVLNKSIFITQGNLIFNILNSFIYQNCLLSYILQYKFCRKIFCD